MTTLKGNGGKPVWTSDNPYLSVGADLREAEYQPLDQGWALRKVKSPKRFSQDVKDFLLQLFLEGEESGIKSDPATVSCMMKSMRAADGKKRFPSSDWLTTQQVSSYFSRLATVARSGKLTLATKEMIQEEELVVAFVERAQREAMHTLIMRDVDI